MILDRVFEHSAARAGSRLHQGRQRRIRPAAQRSVPGSRPSTSTRDSGAGGDREGPGGAGSRRGQRRSLRSGAEHRRLGCPQPGRGAAARAGRLPRHDRAQLAAARAAVLRRGHGAADLAGLGGGDADPQRGAARRKRASVAASRRSWLWPAHPGRLCCPTSFPSPEGWEISCRQRSLARRLG